MGDTLLWELLEKLNLQDLVAEGGLEAKVRSDEKVIDCSEKVLRHLVKAEMTSIIVNNHGDNDSSDNKGKANWLTTAGGRPGPEPDRQPAPTSLSGEDSSCSTHGPCFSSYLIDFLLLQVIPSS